MNQPRAKAQVISLTEYRELLAWVEAEALAEESQELLNLWELDRAINEGLIWMDVARSFVYQPLYCIKGGKTEHEK